MVIPSDTEASIQMLARLVGRYAHARKKAVQSGQITPHDAVVLLLAYGEGIEDAMRVFLQEDMFQPNAAVDQLKAKVFQAVLDIDPDQDEVLLLRPRG